LTAGVQAQDLSWPIILSRDERYGDRDRIIAFKYGM
jgi:hypothetical protein